MRYSIEPKDRIYVKGYGFLSFAKNIGKNLNNKYSKKLLDTAKKSTTDAIKTTSKRVIQKTAQATGDLISNKIADKIVSASKKSNKKLAKEEDVELTTYKKRWWSIDYFIYKYFWSTSWNCKCNFYFNFFYNNRNS